MCNLTKKDLKDLIKKARNEKKSMSEGIDLLDSYISEAESLLSQLRKNDQLSSQQQEVYNKLQYAVSPGLYQG